MALIKKNIKIATVLPYKENYTFNKASAASLWVSEFYKKSKYRSANHIYGHTKGIGTGTLLLLYRTWMWMVFQWEIVVKQPSLNE